MVVSQAGVDGLVVDSSRPRQWASELSSGARLLPQKLQNLQERAAPRCGRELVRTGAGRLGGPSGTCLGRGGKIIKSPTELHGVRMCINGSGEVHCLAPSSTGHFPLNTLRVSAFAR